MLSGLKLSELATSDIEDAWLYTAKTYNADQADDYDTLIWQALRDIRDEPTGPTSRAREDLGAGLRQYHISASKNRSRARIKSPRHMIFYRMGTDGMIEVVRVLHDAMEPSEHIEEGDSK